jgi:hypothetical protein
MRSTPRTIASAVGLAVVLLLAPVAQAYAQETTQTEDQKKKDKDQKKDEKDQKKDEKKQPQGGRGRAAQPPPVQAQPVAPQPPQAQPAPQPQPVPRRQPQPQPQPQPTPQPQPQPVPQRQPRPQPTPQPQPAQQRHPQPQPTPQPQPPALQQRFSQQQQQLIEQERLRRSQYNQRLQQQQNVLQQRAQSLQQQKRTAQYRYQQQYLERLRQQQIAVQNAYDYNRDPYFRTPPSYRYQRGGRYYDVNRYAAKVLQDAVNFGYDQGYQTGRADHADHWRFDYRSSYAYQDADYGYTGLYVDQDQYNYYFRQGFQRGYEDGYYSRHRYGARVSGNLRILGDVLRVIIDLKPLR